MSQTHTIERGSDLRLQLDLRATDGSTTDLTGYDVRLFEASPELGAELEVVDATVGLVRVTAQWRDEWRSGRQMSFRVQISINGRDTSWPEIWVRIR